MGWWLCPDSWLGRRLKWMKEIKVKCALMLSNSRHVAASTCVQGTISRRRDVERGRAIFVGAEVMMDDAPVFLKGSTLFRLPPLYFSSPATPPAMINHHPRTKRNLPIYLSARQPLAFSLQHFSQGWNSSLYDVTKGRGTSLKPDLGYFSCVSLQNGGRVEFIKRGQCVKCQGLHSIVWPTGAAINVPVYLSPI